MTFPVGYHRLSQDVLLLAGSEDHYAPIGQWYRQIAMLKNARFSF